MILQKIMFVPTRHHQSSRDDFPIKMSLSHIDGNIIPWIYQTGINIATIWEGLKVRLSCQGENEMKLSFRLAIQVVMALLLGALKLNLQLGLSPGSHFNNNIFSFIVSISFTCYFTLGRTNTIHKRGFKSDGRFKMQL